MAGGGRRSTDQRGTPHPTGRKGGNSRKNTASDCSNGPFPPSCFDRELLSTGGRQTVMGDYEVVGLSHHFRLRRILGL
jgi:hypothetical protein